MGGGDLNQKKSWHPHTMKNQERVWKAEQADAVEKRRMVELQKEIQEERGREDLTSLGRETGVLPAIPSQGGRKLDWMYNKPGSDVNREDYLLGRSVDRALEQMTAEEQHAAAGNANAPPKNHVEHECIPTSIRSYMDAPSEQVDMQRKLHEDPLVAIRKREMESRQQLLQNPVKLKELHRILKEEENLRKENKKFKKLKKHKKKSKKHKDKKHDDKDLDKKLAEKYNQLKTSLDNGEDMDIDALISLKYSRLTEQLGKDKKKKVKRQSRIDLEEKSSKERKLEKKFNDKSKICSDKNDRSKRRQSVGALPNTRNRSYKDSPPNKNNKKPIEKVSAKQIHTSSGTVVNHDMYKQKSVEKIYKKYDSRNLDKYKHKRGTSEEVDASRIKLRNRQNPGLYTSDEERLRHRNHSSPNKQIDNNEFDIKNRREISEERKVVDVKKCHVSRHRSSSSENSTRNRNAANKYSSQRERLDRSRSPLSKSLKLDSKKSSNQSTRSVRKDSDSSGDEPRKNFGLVSADGKKLQTNSNVKIEFRTNRKEIKKPWVKTERKRLTEAEIEEKRKEMLENASWREKERDMNIKKYQEEDSKLSERDGASFDPDFLKKQLSRAANIGTVEGRIKANINNIQRSGQSMNYNFAKRS